MDTTFRGWSSTLAARVSLVISRLVRIFMGGFVWSGLCIFLLLCMALRLLSLLLTACGSFGLLFTGLCGLVLGVTLHFVLSGIGLVCFVGILALWPAEVGRVHRPIHLLSASAAEIRFRWNPDALAWSRPCLLLSNLAGPLQHFKAAILNVWCLMRLLLTFAAGRIFEVGLCWMSMAPCSSLILLMFEKEIKGLLRSILVGGVWNGFFLNKVRERERGGERTACFLSVLWGAGR